jgi:hypothetical protein
MSSDYPFALHNLAKLLLQDGQLTKAKSFAAKAYQLIAKGKAEADRDLASALLKEWPDLLRNR